jgi:peptidylprolyl isomerase
MIKRYMAVLAPAVLLLTLSIALAACGGDSSSTSPTSASSKPTTGATVTAGTPTAAKTPQATAPATPPPLSGQAATTSSGLKYIDIVEGTGASPQLGQTVVVNYTGWLEADGKKFDSSVDRGQPFSFTIGKGQVIKGWDEGLSTMKVGAKRRLIIPPDLGYGAKANGPIPANATLIFDVELLQVK